MTALLELVVRVYVVECEYNYLLVVVFRIEKEIEKK
jgi:hypothetical protein